MFAWPSFDSYLMLLVGIFLWTSSVGFELFSLGFKLKNPIKGNKVDRLGLFSVNFGFELVEYMFIQSIKYKFAFSLSVYFVLFLFFLSLMMPV